MKYVYAFMFLILSVCIAHGQLLPIPKRLHAGARTGASVGGGISQAMDGLAQIAAAGRKFNADMAEARRRHWELYPDKPGYEEAREHFASMLRSKDLLILMKELGTQDRHKETLNGELIGTTFQDLLDGIAGGYDGGPPRGTQRYFDRWMNQVLNFIGRDSDERHLKMVLDSTIFIEAYDEAYPAYLDYVHMRNFSEFAEAGHWAGAYPTAESLLLDAVRFRDMASGGLLSQEEAERQLKVAYDLYGKQTLNKAANRVRENPMFGAFIVQKGGPIGLPVSDSQENAILYLIGPELSPDKYLLAMSLGLRAPSDDLSALRFVKEFGEEAVLEVAEQIKSSPLMPDAARRKLAQLLDRTKLANLDASVLAFDVDLLKERGVFGSYADFGGGGYWISRNNNEYSIRITDTGELASIAIRPGAGYAGGHDVNESHMLIGSSDHGTRKNTVGLYSVPDGATLRVFERPSLTYWANFGHDCALTHRHAIIASGDKTQLSGKVETVVYDINTGEELRAIPQGGEIAATDNRLIIVSNSPSSSGKFESQPAGTIYDLETGEAICALNFSSVQARRFDPNDSKPPHVFDLAVDEGIVAVFIPNAEPNGIVVCFDITTGKLLSKIDTGQGGRLLSHPVDRAHIENKMALVGERLIVRAQTGESEEDVQHVFDALTGRPLRRFLAAGRKVEPYDGKIFYDGEHLVVEPSGRTIRIPTHQLEADAKQWTPLDDPRIDRWITYTNEELAGARAAAHERERLRLEEVARVEAERLVAAEARLDLSIFDTTERSALDRYVRTKYYDLPMAEERVRATHERTIEMHERRYERFKRLPELRLEMHAYQLLIDENRKYLDSASRYQARDAALKIDWFESKMERARRQIEAGENRDDSHDLPPPLIGTPRRTAKAYAKRLLIDLPRETEDSRRNQSTGAIENDRLRNAFIAELPLVQLELLAVEALIDDLGPRERNWSNDPRSEALRQDLEWARSEYPKREARWNEIRASQSGVAFEPHDLENLLNRKVEPRGPVVVKEESSGGDASKEKVEESTGARRPVDVGRRPVEVVEPKGVDDPGPAELDGFLKALEIARRADAAERAELNEERAVLGIQGIDTYEQCLRWVLVAGGSWDLFARSGDSDDFNDARGALAKIQSIAPATNEELKAALPFVFERYSPMQPQRSSIGELQEARLENGSLDASKAVKWLASEERYDLIRDLHRAEDDLWSREIMVGQQKQRQELPEKSLQRFQEQIDSRREKVKAVKQALAAHDVELEKAKQLSGWSEDLYYRVINVGQASGFTGGIKKFQVCGRVSEKVPFTKAAYGNGIWLEF